VDIMAQKYFRSETTGDSHACLLFWTLPRAVSGPTYPLSSRPSREKPFHTKKLLRLAFRLQGVSERPAEREAQHIVGVTLKSTFIWCSQIEDC